MSQEGPAFSENNSPNLDGSSPSVSFARDVIIMPLMDLVTTIEAMRAFAVLRVEVGLEVRATFLQPSSESVSNSLE